MSLEDRAQDLEAEEWARRNAPRQEKPTYKPGDQQYGPEFCDECDSSMPALRRANGWCLCTECQSAVERSRIRR